MDVDDDRLRLHIGGHQARAGWTILDVQARPGVDLVADVADLGLLADGSVHEVYASHVLEHLGHQERLPRALAELHRVLEPGGRALLSVPDFEAICRLFLDPRAMPSDRYHLMLIAFGGQVDAHDFHHVGLTHEILGEHLDVAGFARVERVERFDLFDDASTVEVLGTPISLNVIAHKRA